MECRTCCIQSLGKSETEFNIRLNNHRKDVNRQNAPKVDQHFKLPNQNFKQHARFTWIEQLDNMKIDKDLATTLRLKTREDFWIEKLYIHTAWILSSIFPTNNQKSLCLPFWYISNNVIFSADGTLTLLDIDFKYMTSNL